MKAMMCLVLLASQTALANGFLPVEKTFVGQGQLITVRLTVVDGKARIFVVGKEAARIDLKDSAQLVRLTAFSNDGGKQELHFTEDGGSYVTTLPRKEPMTLSVSATVGKMKEEIKVKVGGQP